MRYYAIDNMKAFLIFCVVLGHLCEVIHFGGSSFLYLYIYVFHMPAFAFCSGMFADFNPKKIMKNFVYPYLIFQTLYLLFSRYILHSGVNVQYTTPYWLLWYLVAMIIWECSIPFFQHLHRNAKIVWCVAAVLVSLIVGLDETVSYFMTLSRVIVLFPFFLCGYFLRRSKWFAFFSSKEKQDSVVYLGVKVILGLLVGLITFALFFSRRFINPKWLYGSYSYEALDYNIGIRAVFLLFAFVMTAFLFITIPNKPLPLITKIGQNTLPIFLLHGFFIKLIKYFDILVDFEYQELLVLLLTLLIIFLCSSKPITTAIKPLLHPRLTHFQ